MSAVNATVFAVTSDELPVSWRDVVPIATESTCEWLAGVIVRARALRLLATKSPEIDVAYSFNSSEWALHTFIRGALREWAGNARWRAHACESWFARWHGIRGPALDYQRVLTLIKTLEVTP